MKVIARIAGPEERKMKVLTLEPVNRHPPNVIIEVGEREGEQLIRKGLVKAAPVAQNKMAEEGDNKSDPSEAAGEAPKSSSSRAARRSPSTTAKRSAAGAPKKRPGRPKKAPDAE
jgi:hypothetical protein